MKIFKKSYSQDLPISLEKAWDFFSNPGNLSKITPPDMGFQVKSNFNGSEIYPGQLIYYTVKPVFGIKMSWVTEITAVEKEKYFIDYQCAGPYRLWHHEHRFLATEGGVRVEDTIHYAIPLGFIGSIMNSIMVSGRIDQIFNFRKGVLDSLFGK